jgi:ubiquinone/menaquinone biosynthesis C-methylase UbiE
MGYFTIPMAKMAGVGGRVIAADIQEKMLLALKKRAQQAGVEKRVIGHLSSKNSLGIEEQVNFVLAFWMVHEVPDRKRFLDELFSVLKDNGTFLLVEPPFHVTKSNFAKTVNLAVQAGFTVSAQQGSRSVLLKKSPG